MQPSRSSQLLRNARKYCAYIFDNGGYSLSIPSGAQSQMGASYNPPASTTEHKPAIFVQGMMPRSGTVYVGELLRLHPDVYAYPRNWWELPILQHSPKLDHLQREFLWSYEQSMDKIGDHDFVTLFGSGLIAYLQTDVPTGKRMLLKVPSVQYLDYFFQAFPQEYLLLLIRDGRDVVTSTIKTWPQIRFWMACLRWRRAARMVLAFDEMIRTRKRGYWLARFEDAVITPEIFMMKACHRFELDVTSYPFDRVRNLPVRGSTESARGSDVTWKPKAQPKSFRPIGRWQTWSRYRRDMFKLIAGRELISLGYTSDNDW